jgi:hypothetical protein
MNTDSDMDLAALLRKVGPRARPAESAAASVRAVVAAEWRAACVARQRRRRFTAWAAAAGIAVAAVAVWLARPLYLPSHGPVASLARVEGDVEYRGEPQDAWAQLPATATLRPGAELRTGATGRAALRLASGVEIRLDTGSRVAIDDAHRVELQRGGIYVDSGAGRPDASRDLELDTPTGTVRHVGTQYQAHILDDGLRVGVREGRVAVRLRDTETVGAAGEQLTIEADRVSRSALDPHGQAWAWIGAVTPPFAIEGRSVDDLLAWAGRETGRQVAYASPAVAQRAHRIVLKGSVAGLTPDEAVTAVLSTTALRPVLETDRIRIETAAP